MVVFISLNPIRWVLDSIDSVLSFAPEFLRPWIIVSGIILVLYLAGGETEVETEDGFVQFIEGTKVVFSTISNVAKILGHGIVALFLAVGGILLNVGVSVLQAVGQRGSQLVEFDGPLIVIGPGIEITGIKLQIIRVIFGLLGLSALIIFSEISLL